MRTFSANVSTGVRPGNTTCERRCIREPMIQIVSFLSLLITAALVVPRATTVSTE
jgi:hypothetical protein